MSATAMADRTLEFLVVDDQEPIRKLCTAIGASLGLHCAEAASAEAALQHIQSHAPAMILVDLRMDEMSGLDFLETAKRQLPHAEVALMTGFASVESAVHAMKLGAYDYITKPFRVDELKLVLQRMAEKVRLVEENAVLREQVQTDLELHGIVGSSPRMREVLRLIARLKDATTPVLILGESGTGKELVARAIHFQGANAQRPFVAVDCGSLVPTLIESELFGYEKGAFTGALRSKQGLFQAAHGGTIFLDEIGELPLELQAKLLRVLQEKEVRPVGSNARVPLDVRVIAATNQDLETTYRAGRFRKDLYFRLNVVSVQLPALRERKSDIPALVHWFLENANGNATGDAPAARPEITPAAMACLMQYEWPGNVRELQNVIERALALGNGRVIGLDDLPAVVRAPQPAPPSSDALAATQLEELERITIQRVFEQVHGDKAVARRLLGISRATLYRKLKRYQIGARVADA
jgi:two-component system, NtrC family, response regulator AtoC